MKTGHLTGVSLLVLLVLALSTTFTAPPVLAGGITEEPGGTTIDVESGKEFTIRFKLYWDEPEYMGYFSLGFYWDSPKKDSSGTENENFTFVSASAYLEDNLDPISTNVYLTDGVSPADPTKWRYAIVVDHTAGYPWDDNFYVDVVMRASGVGGVSHVAPYNHIITTSDTIDVAESTIRSYSPPDLNITVRVSEGTPAPPPSPTDWSVALALLIVAIVFAGGFVLYSIFRGGQRKRKRKRTFRF